MELSDNDREILERLEEELRRQETCFDIRRNTSTSSTARTPRSSSTRPRLAWPAAAGEMKELVTRPSEIGLYRSLTA